MATPPKVVLRSNIEVAWCVNSALLPRTRQNPAVIVAVLADRKAQRIYPGDTPVGTFKDPVYPRRRKAQRHTFVIVPPSKARAANTHKRPTP
jgi:hypothetical protein